MVDVMPHQLKDMLRDYRDSWSMSTGISQGGDRFKAALILYLTPTFAASVFYFYRVQLINLAPFLTALSVFTALLFALLILMFNTALAIRKDGSTIKNAHGLIDLIGDLRATVTYTIFIGILLVISLAVATTLMVPVDPKDSTSMLVVPWPWTIVLTWLGVHMLINVVKILERFRTAFRYIAN